MSLKHNPSGDSIYIDNEVWKDGFPFSKRVGIIAISYFSFLHIVSLLCVIFIPWTILEWRLCSAILLLYLLPPLLARLILLVAPCRLGIININSNDFIKWWALFNLQVLFCRLPFLEEILRLIPGIYGPWLRLWGAKIGRLTYWAPGLKILDRSFVKIGDDVVFGADVRLNPHVMYKDKNGMLVLALDYITLGDRTLIGGYSLFTAGTIIYPDQSTRALLCLPPFSRFRNGRREKDEESFSSDM
jgi:hypothetical protein